MKIASVKIGSFRSFGADPTTICLDDYTALVGSNGTGKSNVLQVLNDFFTNLLSATLSPTLIFTAEQPIARFESK